MVLDQLQNYIFLHHLCFLRQKIARNTAEIRHFLQTVDSAVNPYVTGSSPVARATNFPQISADFLLFLGVLIPLNKTTPKCRKSDINWLQKHTFDIRYVPNFTFLLPWLLLRLVNQAKLCFRHQIKQPIKIPVIMLFFQFL